MAVEKFSPNRRWQIDTLIKVMCLGNMTHLANMSGVYCGHLHSEDKYILVLCLEPQKQLQIQSQKVFGAVGMMIH